ncbi:Serine/threonine protein kinase [Streptomyces sp. DvalAA-14]|uniref:serine/threonine-protein kinase n=1 Tax=unclassified Streptomyces TaxID=2593676 RepID=UPI00081B86BE|nr:MULTISPECIES: serine/threonine-protein kinase [unclassified Streptomyces]MYS25029.1 protein kinase [Streptomyces sp. SID4948]SCE51505.1 Serine/threonine protein kinase [Streptomyces sp. DvalAA-14]
MASDGGRTTAEHQPRDVIAGRYRITARLGRGGMGTVWRADDELLRRQVAVKELHLPYAGLTEAEADKQRDRALREARGVARIRHPHVVVVHDVVEQDGRPWIVMELVDGRSLADVLTEDGPLEPREAARICAAVAGALRAAHRHDIQHRDVKPANVLIERAEGRGTGRVVLTDFGIARVPGSHTISETGSFVGSPEYTAPERMSGQPAGPASDLWSLGVLLCAAVDGHSPFRRDSIGEIVHAVAIADIVPPAAAGPLLPVVRGLLERDPERRMAAADVQTVLTAFAETGLEPPTPTPELPAPRSPDDPAPAPEPDPEPKPEPGHAPVPSEPPRGPRHRGRTAVAVLAVTAVAVVAGAAAAILVTRGESGGRAAAVSPPALTAAATAATTPAGPPSPETPSSPATTSAARPLPAGFERITDANGFSVALLDGSRRDPEGPRTYYWSPGDVFRFGEREQSPDPRGPYAVMHDQHVAAPSSPVYPGYRDGVITRTTQHGQDAALWEFTYDGFGHGKGPRRTFDLCWTQGDRMYDLWVSGPLESAESTRKAFDTAVASFRAG